MEHTCELVSLEARAVYLAVADGRARELGAPWVEIARRHAVLDVSAVELLRYASARIARRRSVRVDTLRSDATSDFLTAVSVFAADFLVLSDRGSPNFRSVASGAGTRVAKAWSRLIYTRRSDTARVGRAHILVHARVARHSQGTLLTHNHRLPSADKADLGLEQCRHVIPSCNSCWYLQGVLDLRVGGREQLCGRRAHVGLAASQRHGSSIRVARVRDDSRTEAGSTSSRSAIH
jgi:hypothetical protein